MYKSTGIEKNVSQYQLPTRKIIFILFLTKLIKTITKFDHTIAFSQVFTQDPKSIAFN